jgi:azurin
MTTLRHTVAALALLGALAATPNARALDACKLEISGNDMMQYDKASLAVPATCKEVTVTLHHIGKLPKEAMGHNWVLVNAADLNPVASAGLAAGLAADYLAPGDKRVLAHTKVVGGGETASVTFPTSLLKAGGAYAYQCTFPGHNALMHGVFKFG